MEWVALALALVLILGLALARALRDRSRRSTPRRRRLGDPGLTPEDEAELERGLAAVEQEGAHTLAALLDLRLRVLTARRVPLRAIRAAPGPHTGRLAFADGTVLLARARRPGELYRLAIATPDHPVCITSWSHEEDGTVLCFEWSSEHAELLVIGLDQAD